MADNKFVVTGEASESDEETGSCSDAQTEEQQTGNTGYGIAITGEAVESDEEVISYTANPSKSHVSMAAEVFQNSASMSSFSSSESIFQKRLCETNASFWKSLNTFMYSSILSASKELLNVDQQLLKSQVTLQSISYNFKAADHATKQILGKTKDMLTGNFIPSIRL